MNYRRFAGATNATPAKPSESTKIDIGEGHNTVTKEFLMGVVVGASFGIFLAPDSGENTRTKLRQRAERLFRSGPDSESQSRNAATGTRSGVELGTDQSVAEVLNHARKEELMSVNGIGEVTAKRIIRNRPYESAEEAVHEEVIPDETLEKVKEQLVEGNSSTKDAA